MQKPSALISTFVAIFVLTTAARAVPVAFQAAKYNYQLPPDVKDACAPYNNCPIVEVRLAQTMPAYIGEVLNRVMTEDDSPQFRKFARNLDDWAREHFNFFDDGFGEMAQTFGEVTSQKSYSIEPLAPFGDIAQYGLNYVEYGIGAAHELHSENYVLIDTNLQTQIGLYDLLETDDELLEMLKDAYIDYAVEQQGKNYFDVNTDGVTIVDNFYLDRDGITFSYGLYDLGSFAEGQIELTLGWAQVADKLQPHYRYLLECIGV